MTQPPQATAATPGESPPQMLPWYLNGTLAAPDRARVDEWLAQSAQNREQLEFERSIAQAIVARADAVPADIGLPELMQRLRESQPASKPARPRAAGGWLQTITGWLTQPQISWAMAALLAIGSGVLMTKPDETSRDEQYRGLTAAPRPSLRVVFAADTSEGAIRALLAAQQASIIGGPNQLGEYWIAARRQTPAELAAKLQAAGPQVLSVVVDNDGPREP